MEQRYVEPVSNGILGDAVVNLFNQDNDDNRQALMHALKIEAEKETDEDRILLYWRICHFLMPGKLKRSGVN